MPHKTHKNIPRIIINYVSFFPPACHFIYVDVCYNCCRLKGVTKLSVFFIYRVIFVNDLVVIPGYWSIPEKCESCELVIHDTSMIRQPRVLFVTYKLLLNDFILKRLRYYIASKSPYELNCCGYYRILARRQARWKPSTNSESRLGTRNYLLFYFLALAMRTWTPFFDDLFDFKSVDVKALLLFLNISKWFIAEDVSTLVRYHSELFDLNMFISKPTTLTQPR